MNRFLFASTLALALAAPRTFSGANFDWPQWQGPDRNAISKQTGLLPQWPKEGPPLAWRAGGLGGGDGAPAVAGGRVFGMSHRGDDEVVWALAEADGQELWATRLGPAYEQRGWPQSKEGPGCTPTVDGDRLYVLGLGGNLACLQAADGRIVWQRNLVGDFGGRIPTWSYRESPLIDGDKLICTPGGDDATLVALDKRTGELIWKCSVPDHAQSPTQAGSASRPSVMETDPVLAALDADHNKEISAAEIAQAPVALARLDKNQDGKLTEAEVTPESEDRGGQSDRSRRRRDGGPMRQMKVNAALDADQNGEIDAAELRNAVLALQSLDTNRDGKLTEDEVGLRFRAPANSGAAYASAIAIDFGGVRQYVQLTATTLVGVRASDGQVLWRYDKPANSFRINVSTPLYHDGYVFAASAYGAGGGLARLVKTADGGIAAEEVWFSKSMENHHGGVVLVDGCLYGANGGNAGGYLVCLDFKTGEVLWNEADRDKRRVTKGSVAVADGRLYYRTEEGDVVLIEPSRQAYLERGRFTQPDRTRLPAWSHPVLANGKLYLRDQDTLFCYDVKAK